MATRPGLRRLIAGKEGGRCVRIFRRRDGTVVTADCWSRLRAARKQGIVPWLAALAIVAWAELNAVRFGLSGLQAIAERFGPKPTMLSVDWDVPTTRLSRLPCARPLQPEDILKAVQDEAAGWMGEGLGGSGAFWR